MAELALRDGLALQGLDDLGVGLAVGDELFEPAFIDRCEAAREGRLLNNSGHLISLPGIEDTERSVSCTKRAREAGNQKAE